MVNQTEESKLWSDGKDEKLVEDMIREADNAAANAATANADFTDEDSDQPVTQHTSTSPAFIDLLSSPFRRRQLAGMIGVLSATTSAFYILMLWTPIYLSQLRGLMTEADACLLNFVIVGFYIFFLLVSGKLSDQFPHRTDIMKIALPGLIVSCPVMFALFESGAGWIAYVLGQLQLGICLSLMQGSIAAFEVELWMADPTLSFTGVAIGHNLSATLFGGTMPLVATALYYISDGIVIANETNGKDTFMSSLVPRMLPGLYISILGLVSLACVSWVVKHPHDLRVGSPQLKAAVESENRKYQQSLKAKKNRRKLIEQQLNGKL